MKSKLIRNAIILFIIVSIILISVLVFVIEIPFSIGMALKTMIGASMIAMSYLFVMKQR